MSCMVSGPRGRRVLGPQGPARRSAGRDRGDARTLGRGLESRGPGGVHGRLRQRLDDELRVRGPRPVRLAGAVRPLPSGLLHPGAVARFLALRGGAGAATDDRSRLLHGTVQADAGRRGHGERPVHLDPPEAGRSVADHPRSHVGGSQVSGGPAVVVVLLLCAACKPPGEGMIALEGATLVDGSGRDPVKDALLLVKNGHIEAVARVNEVPVPRGAERISLVGKTIIPGLIDAHAHVERWATARYVAWGVTTVRDLHSDNDSAFVLKNDLNLGSVLGPRMFTAGAMIDGAPPTYANATAARTGAEVRKAVDQRAIAGADWVKLYTKITPELLRPLMDEAAVLRLPVAAHLGEIDGPPAARPRGAPPRPMARAVRAAVRGGGWGPADFAAFRRSRPRQDQFVREFQRAGGLIAAGSDAPNQLLVPGASLHDELSLLVAAGLTPLDAVAAATRRAAQLLRADSLGQLAPRKVADLVVLNRDPAADITATRDIAWVMIRGRIIHPDSLRKTWAH